MLPVRARTPQLICEIKIEEDRYVNRPRYRNHRNVYEELR